MKVILIRHGKTPSSPKGKILPDKIWNDPLSPQGIEESIRLADQIPKDVEYIFCPKFLRFTQTVDAMRTKLPHLKTEVTPEIEGIHFGKLGGLTWGEVAAQYSPQLEKDFKQHVYNFHSYGGESYMDVNKRIVSFLENLRNKMDKVVIVTSGGITRAVYKMTLNQTFDIIPSGTMHTFDFLPQKVHA